MAPALSSLTYSAPSGPATASATRPYRLPFGSWKPATSVTAAPSVWVRLSHGIHSTAGARGGCRFQEPCTATTAPPDHGAAILLPARNDRPSGALCAGSPTSIGFSAAQFRLLPPGLVTASATNGMSTSDPAGWLLSWSGLQYGQPRSRPGVTGATSSGGCSSPALLIAWPDGGPV